MGLSLYLYTKLKRHNENRLSGINLRSFLNSLPLSVYLRDLKGNIILANNEFAKMTGYSINRLKNINIYDIYKSECFIEEDNEIITKKQNLRVKRKMQSHNYEIFKSPILDGKNNVIGVINLINNIDKEQDLQMRKSNFVATPSHDLKSPTNAQLNMLGLLVNGAFGELNPKQREIIELITSSCKYVSDLASTVVDTYSYNFGHLVLKRDACNMYELIETICQCMQTMAKAKNQTIHFSGIPAKSNPIADYLQIKRVVTNLLSNAINYGQPDSDIKVSLLSDQENIEVIVRNKSRYIPPNELEVVFDRFKRAKFSGYNSTGAGLGLYLCKQIISLHNGKIFANSFEDGTCIFGFKIPAGENKLLANPDDLKSAKPITTK